VNVAGIVDAAIEAPIVTSFSKLGYDIRRRTDHWQPLESYDLSSRTVVVTGATTGLGHHAAVWFAELGARVIVTGRQRERAERAAGEITTEAGGQASIVPLAADMADLDQVRELAGKITAVTDRLDVLVHNAGALSDVRRTNADGVEATVAGQVLGPFLLTSLLRDTLRSDVPGRVITVSSGGMYAAKSTVEELQMPAAAYRGSEQYARAKRAQVTLNALWAARVTPTDVVFHAMHPGWADTPGVEAALPRFRCAVGPLLRSAEQGSDTAIWLACDERVQRTSGGFWLDRRRRGIHRLPQTRRADTVERRAQLWAWCVEQTGVDRGHRQ
jgi:NAD(P)-dependent dehydrogenase (short-subunit alcohol dehydrogenase family)